MSVDDVLDRLLAAGEAVWRASWQASVLAALVVAIHLVFGRRIPARWRHAMWMLVLVRLALPVVPSSPVSIYNLAPAETHKPAVDSRDVAALPVEITRADLERAIAAAAAAPMMPAARRAPYPVTERRDAWDQWPQTLAAIWAAGVMLLSARIGLATWRVSRVTRRLQRVEDPAVLTVLHASARELRVRHVPLLLTGAGDFSPALVGVLRPRLLLPRDLFERFNATELRLVFLHELAHLKRRDVATNWLATLLTTLHWLNPVVWLVAHRIRLERELACDELVMSRTTDTDRKAYGHTIVRLLETFSRRHAARPMPGSVGILEGHHQMKRRITMIARFAKTTRMWTIAAALIVVTLALVALTDAVRAQNAKAADAAKPPAGKVEAAPPVEGVPAVADPAAVGVATADPPPAAASAMSQEDRVARAMLDRTIREVPLDATPLSDVIDMFRDMTSANIHVNWRALEEAGIDKNAPVTAKLRDVKFSYALDLILADIGGSSVKLDYVIENGVLSISTAADLQRKAKLLVYDVSDLLTPDNKSTTAEATAPAAAGAMPTKAGPTSRPAPKDKETQLIELVQEMVDPDSWREAGGSVGAISIFDGRMVVMQTTKTQEKIADFLEKMRNAKKK